MEIKATTISLKYKRIDGIKSKFLEKKYLFKEDYNEETMLPIPDEAPNEIPRIVFDSKSGHTRISITPIVSSIQINYDNGYETDWDKCQEYIQKTIKTVMEFFDELTGNCYEYFGVVTSLILDDYTQKTIEMLSHNLLKKPMEGLYDINIKYTFTIGKEKFVNITIQNARMFEEGVNPEQAGSLAKEKQIADKVACIIDINNRLGFNSESDYSSTSEKMQELIDEMTYNINGKIEKLVEEGVY